MDRKALLRRNPTYTYCKSLMKEVYVIQSDSGDEYKLEFTTERSGLIAAELLDRINSEGIEVVEIGLGRTRGVNPVSPLVLA